MNNSTCQCLALNAADVDICSITTLIRTPRGFGFVKKPTRPQFIIYLAQSVVKQMKSSTEIPTFQGKKPSFVGLELQKAGIKLFAGSIDSLDNAARNLVGLTTTLLPIYMGILSFFKINGRVDSPFISYYLLIILFIWLLSVVFSALAFIPFKDKIDLNCITEIEDTLYKILNRKQKCLLAGFVLFIVFNLLSISLLWFGVS
jgi:hypothetical protein